MAVYPCLLASTKQPTSRLGSTPRTASQMRTLRAALELFAEYGVGATSYQMIADATGVTKGAIYHQFETKDEIVIAVAEMELAKLEDALEAAEELDCRSESLGVRYGCGRGCDGVDSDARRERHTLRCGGQARLAQRP